MAGSLIDGVGDLAEDVQGLSLPKQMWEVIDLCCPKSTSVRKLCTMISFCSTLTADSRTDVLFGQDKAPLGMDAHDG